MRREILERIDGDWRLGRLWDLAIAWLVPLQAVVLLGWWMYLSATVYAPATWFDPLDPYSVATCGVQWGVGASVCLLIQRWRRQRRLSQQK